MFDEITFHSRYAVGTSDHKFTLAEFQAVACLLEWAPSYVLDLWGRSTDGPEVDGYIARMRQRLHDEMRRRFTRQEIDATMIAEVQS